MAPKWAWRPPFPSPNATHAERPRPTTALVTASPAKRNNNPPGRRGLVDPAGQQRVVRRGRAQALDRRAAQVVLRARVDVRRQRREVARDLLRAREDRVGSGDLVEDAELQA